MRHGRNKSTSGRLTCSEGPTRNGNSLTDKGWGDINQKDHGLRIGFMNVNSFPMDSKQLKNSSIIQLYKQYHLHLLGMAEMNIYWPKLTHSQQLSEQVRPWFEQRATVAACNIHGTKVRNQPGGVGYDNEG